MSRKKKTKSLTKKSRGKIDSVAARSKRCCKWKKPDHGWIKLNTDGSKSGYGGLFRDHKGEAVRAFVSKATFGDDTFLSELSAVHKGLVLALRMGIKTLLVESDSESVVKTINRKQRYRRKVADSCLKQVRKLLNRFDKCKLTYSSREMNRSADCLSRMVFPDRDNVVLKPKDFPATLSRVIAAIRARHGGGETRKQSNY